MNQIDSKYRNVSYFMVIDTNIYDPNYKKENFTTDIESIKIHDKLEQFRDMNMQSFVFYGNPCRSLIDNYVYLKTGNTNRWIIILLFTGSTNNNINFREIVNESYKIIHLKRYRKKNVKLLDLISS